MVARYAARETDGQMDRHGGGQIGGGAKGHLSNFQLDNCALQKELNDDNIYTLCQNDPSLLKYFYPKKFFMDFIHEDWQEEFF